MTAFITAIAEDLGVRPNELVVAAVGAVLAFPFVLGLLIGLLIGAAA